MAKRKRNRNGATSCAPPSYDPSAPVSQASFQYMIRNQRKTEIEALLKTINDASAAIYTKLNDLTYN